MIRALLFCISNRQNAASVAGAEPRAPTRRTGKCVKRRTEYRHMTESVFLLSLNECACSCGLGLGGCCVKRMKRARKRESVYVFASRIRHEHQCSPSLQTLACGSWLPQDIEHHLYGTHTPVQYGRIMTADIRSTISPHCSV